MWTIITIVCVVGFLWELCNAAHKGWGEVAWFLVTTIASIIIIAWFISAHQEVINIAF